jgi:hypothetical protein
MRLRVVAGLMAMLCATCAGERRSPAPAAAPDAGVHGVEMDPELFKRYRVVKRGDAILYCRPEILTGTRFPKTTCLSASELKAEQIRAREMLHSLDEGQPNFCNGKPCTGL